MNEVLYTVEQILDDFAAAVSLFDWPGVQYQLDCVTDQLHGRPLIGVLVEGVIEQLPHQ